MKREIWRQAFGQPTDALSQRVSSTLSSLKKEEIIMKRSMLRCAVLALCLVFLLIGTVWAVTESDILSLLGRYDESLTEKQQRLIQTEFAEDTASLGPITVTLKEMISDGFAATVSFEYEAPENVYLYTDLVEMTKEEWEMDEAARLAQYGPYYVLTDFHAEFATPLSILEPPGESMLDAQRIAPNIIRASITFPVTGMPLDTLQIRVGAWEVREPGKEENRYGAALFPRYTIGTEPIASYSLSFDPADTPFGLTRVDIALTPLTTHFTVWCQEGLADCLPYILDAEGDELPFGLLGSFGGYQEGAGCRDTGYGPLESIPDTLQLQMMRWDETTGDMAPWGESITLSLR